MSQEDSADQLHSNAVEGEWSELPWAGSWPVGLTKQGFVDQHHATQAITDQEKPFTSQKHLLASTVAGYHLAGGCSTNSPVSVPRPGGQGRVKADDQPKPNVHRVKSVMPNGQPPESLPLSDRFVLWIDSVGGFLVCLNDVVTLGQAGLHAATELSIVGNLSRNHARVCRSGEGYFVQPSGEVRVADQLRTGMTALVDQEEFSLGSSVKLRFRQPHPWSGSACLDLVSNHRMQPAVDGVVLMADACVLGPGSGCHVVCRKWESELVIFRQGGQLFCRSDRVIEIDGESVKGVTPIRANTHLCGTDFAMSLEPLE